MRWYLSCSRGTQILITVLVAHGLLLSMLGVDHWMHHTPIKRKKVAVHTVILTSQSKQIEREQSPKIAKEPQKEKIVKTTKKTASLPKKEETLLLKEIEESLESLTKATSFSKKSEIIVPTLDLQISTQVQEPLAAEQIAALLQETLELPEFGLVKVKLSIGKVGTLENLEILEAKSQKNAAFLKKRLPELQFPCLNEVTTLTIVFSNAL